MKEPSGRPRRCLYFAAAVGTYRDPGMREIHGAVRDAERLRATLQACACNEYELAGWMMDGNARKQAILRALVKLAAMVTQNDQLVLYLAMHACRKRDATGTRWIYYLLPWDATEATASTDGITTEELGRHMRQIEAIEVVLIVDSCHAGGVPDISLLEEMREDLQEGWRHHFFGAAASGRAEVIERGDGGFIVPAFCEALRGVGVVPDSERRISVQQAWDRASVVAAEEAARDGYTQLAMSGGFAGPIMLSCLGRESQPGLVRCIDVYAGTQDPRFCDAVAALIPRSRRILLLGTSLSILLNPRIMESLSEHARDPNVRVDLLLGNPFNPSVQNRLIEEEMYGRVAQIGKLRLERLFPSYVELVNELSAQGRMNVRLFEHYPTIGVLVFDDRVFVYFYGYREFGTKSPVLSFPNDGGDDVRFIIENAETSLQESVPAVEVMRARHKMDYLGPGWVAAAVYAIPEADEPLYQFGSAILGYNIRSRRAVSMSRCAVPGIRPHVGEAAEYGFHVTLGDALYFATDAAVERVKAEVRFLAAEFKPFDLGNFDIVHPYHGNPAVVAMRCSDPSGAAEVLHHEMVSRVYSTAISSVYRAGTTTKEYPTDRRAQLMIERFGMPWILKRFDPHFTLCSSFAVEPEQQFAVVDGMRAAMSASVPASQVRIQSLCVVVRKPGQKRWTIAKSFPLVGTAPSV